MTEFESPAKKPRVDHSEKVASTFKQVSETDVGMRCFISSGFQPIPGIVKQRFSDFIVNEIDTDDVVVRLTSSKYAGSQDSNKDITDKQADIELEVPPLLSEKLDQLQKLSESPSTDKVKVEAPQEKEERRKIHMYIKTKFPVLDSNCIEIDGKKYLEVSKASKGNRGNRGNFTEEPWPKSRPPNLNFVLYKEFKDTTEAIDIISKYSNLKANMFAFAGTKDKRAKTTQQVSIFKVTAEKLDKVNSKLYGIVMGDFQYSENKLRLGQLNGNHFKVVLRNVNTTAENLKTATEVLKSSGFVNYFGMQRFGTTLVPTYEVGKQILIGEFKKAVDLIMSVRESDREDVKDARNLWLSKSDANGALAGLPKSCNIERRLMQGVIKSGVNKLSSAFENLPRNSRLLYLHSYQSLIWNKLASMRIEKYGLDPIEGDLVAVPPPLPESSEEKEATGDVDSRKSFDVMHLTKEDLGKFTIEDVVLPLPGYNIQLPQNEVKLWMDNLLKEDDLDLMSFKTKYKDYRLPGSYRKLVIKPKSLTTYLTYYDDVKEELVLSDLDLLNNKVVEQKSSGAYQAVVLEFSLPSSTYATMLLRELMRTDTSAHHQTSLNSNSSRLASSNDTNRTQSE